ncbi:S-layer homology domain-containing protein [Rubidibacter lacunae]|uniref:S-layer homology domain-containing protein n=1 Tax=Rubidibacter lacunae TaxID=582514 RepID=UPI0018DD1EA4|nr:S-layer homology domain-containing protein [Rubidibacter lacunae]
MSRFQIRGLVRCAIAIGALGWLSACSSDAAWQERLAPDPGLNNGPEVTETFAPEFGDADAANATRPEALPEAIPVYPEVRLLDDDTADNRGRVLWESDSGLTPIASFYKRVLNEDGWILDPIEIASEPAIDPTKLSARRGNLNARIELTQANLTEPTTIALTYERQTRVTPPDYTPPDAGGAATPPAETHANGNTARNDAPESESFEPAVAPGPKTFVDISAAPEALQPYLRDVAALGVLDAATGDRFVPNEPVSRGDFARWLVAANNLMRERPGDRLRAIAVTEDPVFADVPPSAPEFPAVQGLAEAGLIPSQLSGDLTVKSFRPEAPLTRETLLLWKVPLDLRQGLPTATVETVRAAWGFQDIEQVDPIALSAVLADYNNGDRANIRRVYGFTRLLQPQKPVTRAEAAAALWFFGTRGDGNSAAAVVRED